MATDSNALLNYIQANFDSKFVMLDIGSKAGKWLVPFVTAFPKAEFHTFEALPEQHARVVHRFRKNSNVQSYNCVLSDRNESAYFYRDKKRMGWSGLRKHQYLEEHDKISVETTTIDSMALSADVIKVDVEGAELLVLQGAKHTLENCKVVFFECNEVHFKEYNYTAEQLYDFFVEQNFTIFDLDLEKVSKEDFTFLTADQRRYENFDNRMGNFFGIKNEKPLE